MKITLESLQEKLGTLKRDESLTTEVLVENERDKYDTFIASWKYPINQGVPEFGNYIQMSYRFMLDVDHLKLLWQKKYETGFVHMNETLAKTFFEILPHLADANGKADEYDKILEILYPKRGVGMTDVFVV